MVYTNSISFTDVNKSNWFNIVIIFYLVTIYIIQCNIFISGMKIILDTPKWHYR